MNSPRKFFLAIRHKPTGGLLPAVKGYGFTRAAPTHDEAPRLFKKLGPAKQALARWLEGELYEGAEDDESNQISLRLVPKKDRKACDMELVEIEVLVRSLSEAQLRRL